MKKVLSLFIFLQIIISAQIDKLNPSVETTEVSEIFNISEMRKVLDSDTKIKESSIDETRRYMPLGWVNILHEGFEGSFPGVWNVFANNDYTDAYWEDESCKSQAGGWSGFCAGAGTQGVLCGSNHPANMNGWMVYGPFSLENTSAATVTFWDWLATESNVDYLRYMVSINGSQFYGYQISGNTSDNWEQRVFDLANVPTLGNLCGQKQVWIAFQFTSDGSVNNPGAYIDEIYIDKNTTSTIVHTLTVQSDPSSASITISPADNNGNSSGSTSFTRSYNDGISVTLTAPATVVGAGFHHWEKDGVQVTALTSYVCLMDGNHTMKAIYASNKTISGNISTSVGTPVSGVDVTFSGIVAPATTDANGNYTKPVSYGYTGTATPTKSGYTFSPASRSYNNVVANQTSQNYGATVIIVNISFDKTVIDFGDLICGKIRVDSITIINSQNSTNNLVGNVTISDTVFVIYKGGGLFNILPGEEHKVIIWFAPHNPPGTRSGILTITHNATNQTSPFNIPISGVTGIKDLDIINDIPSSYQLSNNYPNPFNPSTHIEFDLPEESANSLKVYDIIGNEVVALLYNETLPAGKYSYNLVADNLPSGVYIYVLISQSNVSKQSFRDVKKMILLK